VGTSIPSPHTTTSLHTSPTATSSLPYHYSHHCTTTTAPHTHCLPQDSTRDKRAWAGMAHAMPGRHLAPGGLRAGGAGGAWLCAPPSGHDRSHCSPSRANSAPGILSALLPVTSIFFMARKTCSLHLTPPPHAFHCPPASCCPSLCYTPTGLQEPRRTCCTLPLPRATHTAACRTAAAFAPLPHLPPLLPCPALFHLLAAGAGGTYRVRGEARQLRWAEGRTGHCSTLSCRRYSCMQPLPS